MYVPALPYVRFTFALLCLRHIYLAVGTLFGIYFTFTQNLSRYVLPERSGYHNRLQSVRMNL